MSALQVLIEGVLRAAELLALLVVLPVSTLEVRAVPVASPIETRAEALRLHRRERIVNLLHVGECDGDVATTNAVVAVRGHARLTTDEAIADALPPAGPETTMVDANAAHSTVSSGAFFRLAVSHSAIESRALLVDQPGGPLLVMIIGSGARGVARLTLRPSRGSSETIELGDITGAQSAYVVPLADRAALEALATGAIELEAQAEDYSMWSTIPAQLHTGASLVLLRAAE
jgi:hypothetical protein